MIELKNVNYKYKNGTTAIKNINLEIHEGEVVSIIGKNGSRKVNSCKGNGRTA
ncbi:MAG: hypothetical protein FWC47_03165 [Oscillospiraceae bacterium]|nr:hypothetical protein [Oscillospiraceae bacterium]